MASIAAVLGIVVGIFAKYFKVDSDARIELVLELLPGANCGGCGQAGCADFAKSVVLGINPPNKCPVSSREQVSAIASALGIEEGAAFSRQAIVKCGGDMHHSNWLLNYNGVIDCASASLVSGGPKGCSHGCLGMGNCARKCPFGAIEIVDHIALVHPELCVGCGLCVQACPRHCIELVPASATVHVYCNSPEKGADVRQNCRVGCLGCGKCTRVAGDKFIVENNLAKTNYNLSEDQLPTAVDVAAVKCPTHALLTHEAHYRIEKSEEFHI
jgi:Na+-translocating ferredoxin:NAD+ oxidoreductase RNF subunit RnfB